jgi:hypothetical protein
VDSGVVAVADSGEAIAAVAVVDSGAAEVVVVVSGVATVAVAAASARVAAAPSPGAPKPPVPSDKKNQNNKKILDDVGDTLKCGAGRSWEYAESNLGVQPTTAKQAMKGATGAQARLRELAQRVRAQARGAVEPRASSTASTATAPSSASTTSEPVGTTPQPVVVGLVQNIPGSYRSLDLRLFFSYPHLPLFIYLFINK